MDEFARIEARFQLHVPTLYGQLHAQGCFDPEQPGAYVRFTDHRWLSPADIAEHVFEPWQTLASQFFVPFAHSARRDFWGWRNDWTTGDESAVVFLERGPNGHGLAADFRGYLYRLLLEEFSGTWLLDSPDDEEGQAHVLHAVEMIAPHLPAQWGNRLAELARQSWQREQDGTICVFPRAECDRIVAQDLAFDHLNEVIQQQEVEEEDLAQIEQQRAAMKQRDRERAQQRFRQNSSGPACPKCGKPLRTAQAKQCFSCGAHVAS